MTLRILVCDDEPLAVSRLSSMIGELPDAEVAGTAFGGREALERIYQARPDLVLLDVEMPEADGFDVIEMLARRVTQYSPPPLFAFVTAFRQFAPQAFDTGVIDFLSKPVRRDRLQTTIRRAKQAIESREAASRLRELERTMDTLRKAQTGDPAPHIWVPRRGEFVRVDLQALEWIVAEGAYVRLHIGKTSHLYREAIGSIEQKLDPARFIRVHRSYVVRTDHVAMLRRTHNGGGEIVLYSGDVVPIGRKYAQGTRRHLQAYARRHAGQGSA